MTMIRDLDRQVRFASGFNWLLGLALCIAPWFFRDTSAYHSLTINSMATGALIMVCAALRVRWPHRGLTLSAANVALGFWTLIAPVAFDYSTRRGHLWTNIVIGVALMVFGMWSISARLSEQR
jgi:hypothetical protein